jgi:hypothetical protein
VIGAAGAPPHVSDQFAAHIVWLGDEPMLPGRPYLLRLGTATTTATVSELKHRLDVASGSQRPAKQLEPNDIGLANLSLDRALPFDSYDDNRETGGFILIDRLSNATVGAGMIRFPLRRAANLAWQDFTVDKAARAASKGHRPAVLWFTGLSGSGKSTIADGVERRLTALGRHTYLLDGDNVRHGLNRDLGFLDEQGYLTLVGRLKELINRGGEKISPREIDEVLLTHPAVGEAVCFGVPHKMWGEEVAAAVTLKGSATEADLLAFCKEQLAEFKRPKQIHITDAIPRTATGKIQRRVVAQAFAPPTS